MRMAACRTAFVCTLERSTGRPAWAVQSFFTISIANVHTVLATTLQRAIYCVRSHATALIWSAVIRCGLPSALSGVELCGLAVIWEQVCGKQHKQRWYEQGADVQCTSGGAQHIQERADLKTIWIWSHQQARHLREGV